MSPTAQGITNAYTGFGELASTTSNVGGTSRTLAYLYDADSNRIRITHPDASFFTYAYDGLDRPNAILEGAATNLVTIVYDPLGRRSSLARTGAGSTAYVYDNAGRLATLANDLAASTNDQTLTFAYNPASQNVTRTGSNDTYAYTAMGSGSTATVPNGLNQIATKDGTAFAYDANGNLTGDGATTFAYDTENRLTSATGAKNATLVYDPTGRLSSTVSGGTTTRLLYDGDDLIAEYDGATLLRRYVHGPLPDEPLVQYEGATLATKRLLHADQQASVIAVTDASGALLTINRYDEYGVPQATNVGRFQYTGQQWLPELGVYYYKARMYRPGDGMFMQTDPVGYDSGINLYAYVGLDPVNKSDPSGTEDVYNFPDGSALIILKVNNQSHLDSSQVGQLGMRLSGVTSDLNFVTVQIEMVDNGQDVTMITDPTLFSNSPFPQFRSHADAIDGSKISLSPTANFNVAGHEFGHILGGGDQKAGGIDANGERVETTVPGPQNLMRDAKGSVNAQSADEFKSSANSSPKNDVTNCSKGSALGGRPC